MAEINKGDRVVCILNNRASLTVGKEYEVLNVSGTHHVDVRNDHGEWITYTSKRFMPVSDFRGHKIKHIQNHINQSDDNS